jgi:hypothetical protein
MRRFGRIASLAGAVAFALSIGLLPALAPARVAAARPDLTLVGHATYDVLPDEGRVAVSVRLRATNHLRDTVARRFFFRTAFLTVLPGTSHFRISGGSGNPKVSVAQRTADYTNLRIDFGANLAAGRSTTLTLTFDLDDSGGAPERPVRITPSIVSFSAWAFATPDTPGATVELNVPAGYTVAIGRGPLDGPTTTKSGEQAWTSGSIAEPLEFVADVVADRLGTPVETLREVTLTNDPAAILVRSWPDDTAWSERVLGLLERALPLLEDEIGVPWPIDRPLILEESLTRGTDSYAGLFDPAAPRIEVSYAASDVIILHELAHAWFNGSLVADRWAAEAFASYYADIVAIRLGLAATPLEPVDPAAAVAIPLNAWGEGEPPEAEAYAYAASLELARAISDRIGAENLRRTWALVAARIAAYPPDPAADPLAEPGAAEQAAGPPDWRGLLDTLEERAGQPLDDLWRTWVARPEDLLALDERGPARAAYGGTLEAALPWWLPPSIREAMRAWQFDVAGELSVQAEAVLVQRDALEASAAAAGVTLPDRLRQAFEGTGGLDAAAAEAEFEQAIVDAVASAEAARPATTDPGEQIMIFIGLIAADPEGRLALARTSLTVGDIETAYVAALVAEAAWIDAADLGRTRLVSTVLLTLALLLLASLVRQRRRRVLADAGAKAAGPADRSAAPPGDKAAASTER